MAQTLVLIASALSFIAIVVLGVFIPAAAVRNAAIVEGIFNMTDNPIDKPEIITIGTKEFDITGELPQLVTFLNKTLKYRGLIFGLTRNDCEKSRITVYEVMNFKP